MSDMTPQEARDYLTRASCMGVAHHERRALETLAAEQIEYTQEIFFQDKWQPICDDLWYDTPDECADLWTAIEPWKYQDEPLRIVARRVSEPWEVKDE